MPTSKLDLNPEFNSATVQTRRVKFAACLALTAMLFGCSKFTSDHAMHESSNGEPINYLVYDESFSSAGMPDAAFIETLATQGVDIVINIAPPTISGTLQNEAELVADASMTYLNIAVDWNEPTQGDVNQFLAYMQTNAEAKVFLHCKMNMRATAFAMLHRVINENMDPEVILVDMHKIWKPNATWAKLMNTAFENHNIDYKVAVPTEPI